MASGLTSHAMEERRARSLHEYFVCGLRIRSEIPLPELASGQPVDGAPVIDIRFGDAGPALAPRASPIFEANADEYRHEVPDTARYRIRNGDEIVIAPLGRSSAALMRIFLLGTGLAALCHQRGLLPLHASAIAIAVDGGCVAFAGPPGAGKSTLAAFFHDRGYDVLSDDLCVVSFAQAERPLAWPGVPRFKLARDAVAALGRDVRRLTRCDEVPGEFHLPFDRPAAPALPLRRLYVLADGRPGIHKLGGADAFEALLANTHRAHLVEPMGRTAAHFENCTTLLKHAGVYAASRRHGLDLVAAEAAILERHFRDDA